VVLALVGACGRAEVSDDKGAAADTGATYAEAFRSVRVDASLSVPDQLAVHACAGLYNRRLGGSVFVQTDEDVPQSSIDGAVLRDEVWLETLGLTPSETVGAQAFLDGCVADFGGCVHYDYATQQTLLPAILTAAAATGVVPLSTGSIAACAAPNIDAVDVFADRATPIAATDYAREVYLKDTTGLAMLNPGYNRQPADLANPDVTDDMPVALVDLVFSRKLFVTFLVNGCVDGHPEEAVLDQIIDESGWETPIGVYGYNDSWLAGGYVYEAQTRCLDAANMGAIPTRTTNLSFFDTRRPAITEPAELPTAPPPSPAYDPNRTYVAFVIGDGDNIRYIFSTRRAWLEQRLAACASDPQACPPLTWTISPHLPDLAPDVLHWYFASAARTGADTFMLPPSGYQYAYPSMMPDAVQSTFARRTEEVARLLGTRSVVHWEWFQDWTDAVATYLPRYAHADGQIQGVFPVNVPYLAEAFPEWPADRQVEVLTGEDGGQVALFRSQSWRGVDGRDDFHPTPAAMAERLGALPNGTVTWVYMTSDGGLSFENSYQALIPLLPEHVTLVSADDAAALAIDAAGR
jgi:hypothetical protein